MMHDATECPVCREKLRELYPEEPTPMWLMLVRAFLLWAVIYGVIAMIKDALA